MDVPRPPRPPAARRPLRVLVVEGGCIEMDLLNELEQRDGLTVRTAPDGQTALDLTEEDEPDVVLLDVDLPDHDGLAVLQQMRSEHAEVPVVVLAYPDGAARIEAALDLGAVSFVCKPAQWREIHFVLDRIRQVMQQEDGLTEALGAIIERRTRMELPADLQAIPRVVNLLGRELTHHYPGYRVPLADIKLALYEALANAVEHGNLEIDFQGKAEALIDPGGLAELVRRRRRDPRFANRLVHVEVSYRPEEVVYRVRDEGPGFDPHFYLRRDPLRDTESLHGRGLALIRHHMDEVEWNGPGNEIRMRRRLERRATKADTGPAAVGM